MPLLVHVCFVTGLCSWNCQLLPSGLSRLRLIIRECAAETCCPSSSFKCLHVHHVRNPLKRWVLGCCRFTLCRRAIPSSMRRPYMTNILLTIARAAPTPRSRLSHVSYNYSNEKDRVSLLKLSFGCPKPQEGTDSMNHGIMTDRQMLRHRIVL